jgi:glyoxylase-like metal-dependent hydrolase (beta-lactamase superfamily II)
MEHKKNVVISGGKNGFQVDIAELLLENDIVQASGVKGNRFQGTMIRREKMEIHPRVSAIDVSGLGGIWTYLVRGQKTAIIDTGPKMPLPFVTNQTKSPVNDVAPVLQLLPPVLEKYDMTLADIDLILNTHIHFDHTAGNAAIKTASKGQILIHSDEAEYFEKTELLFERELVPIIEIILGKEYIAEEMNRFMNEFTGPGPYAAVDRRLKDNDMIELGEGYDLKVIHLPGHTQGSVGFYWEDEGILFAGDALEGVCGHDGGLPIIEDLLAYEKSLQRVQQLPLEVLVHSHPFRGLTIPPSTVMRDGKIKQYLEECLEFTQMLQEAAKSVAPHFSEKPFLKLYDEVALSLPKNVGFKPSSEMSGQFFSAKTLLNCIRQLGK